MNREDIIRMAREAGFVSAEFWPENFQGLFGCAERFAALVAAAERAAMMQLFTDPENQPTQHGTVTVEYMQREIAAERKRSEQEMSMMSEHCAEQILMEREACARIAERSESGLHCAFAIRARGRA